VHAEPSHWGHEISLSKTVCHHFWPGLMAGAEFWRQGKGFEMDSTSSLKEEPFLGTTINLR